MKLYIEIFQKNYRDTFCLSMLIIVLQILYIHCKLKLQTFLKLFLIIFNEFQFPQPIEIFTVSRAEERKQPRSVEIACGRSFRGWQKIGVRWRARSRG